MARNDFQDTRFLFPDMFSFSFDPEILTFLWGLCARKIEDVQPMFSPKSALLQVFVPYDNGQPTHFLTSLRYSVVTTGVIIVVGFSSYFTFRLLQKVRREGFQGLKSSVLGFLASVKRPSETCQVVGNLELVPRRGEKSAPIADLRKRPSDLQLSISANGSLTRTGNGLSRNVVPVRSLSVTPINGEIASGDEDVEDIQSQYFGPTVGEATPQIPAFGSQVSPLSPESAYRARYEFLRTPETPTQQRSSS